MGAQRRVFRGARSQPPGLRSSPWGPRSCISHDFPVDAESGGLPKSKEALGLIPSREDTSEESHLRTFKFTERSKIKQETSISTQIQKPAHLFIKEL